MTSPFDAVHEQIDKDFPVDAPGKSPESSQQSNEATDTGKEATAEAAQAIADLSRFQKIKFQGQEWTLDELEKAVMRQKDYTQKTMALAEERKALESEKKFIDNLPYDLEKVRRDPSLVQQFIATYPAKYHAYLKDVLQQSQGPATQPTAQGTPQLPVELMSEIHGLRSYVEQQKVAQAEIEIESVLSKAMAEQQSKFKFPENAYKDHLQQTLKESVLAKAFELHNRGTKLTADLWNQLTEESFKHQKTVVDAYYSEMIKQQQKANAKARDVGPGGGTPGQAPKKVNPFSKEYKSYVENQIRGSRQ